MWKFFNGQEVFRNYRQQWDDLNSKIDNHVLLDSKFWEALLHQFSNEKTLLGVCDSHEFPGMALVESDGLGMWSTFQPSQAPIGPILLGNSENIEGQLKEILRGLPGYALGIGITQQDPSFGYLNTIEAHDAVEMKDYVTTSRISVREDFEQYWNARGNDLRTNVRKRLRRLEREGFSVFLDIHSVPEEMGRCLQQYGDLEETGWKGRNGTAVTTTNTQGRFYKRMLESFCQTNEAEIYSLRFNDNTVAQKICLRRNGMVVFLKMAYDEHYKHLSPGYLLQYEILQRLFNDKDIDSVETYGRVNEGWTDKWTNDFRTMYHLNFFRHPGLILAKNIFGGSSIETQVVR